MTTVTDDHVLVAYVDGSNLHDVAPLLRSRLQGFIQEHSWCTNHVCFVDQVHERDSSIGPDDFPAWDLGINLGLDHIKNQKDWFVDVEALGKLLKELHNESGRDFVLFLVYRSKPWLQEHLCFVDGKPIAWASVRKMIENLTKA